MASSREWNCKRCNAIVSSYGGRDVSCGCGAEYNGFGQRLRDNWRDNASLYDDEIGDLEGYEIGCLRRELA